eukprot:11652538-Alexandrium_andersonii.AAC.1
MKQPLYARRFLETLGRASTQTFWVNSGHTIADSLAKKWPAAHGQLLLAMVQTNTIKITYCDRAWRKKVLGALQHAAVPDPEGALQHDEAEAAHEFIPYRQFCIGGVK